MKKLLSKRGETLIETLCALVVATLTLAFLASSVTSSTALNTAVRDRAADNVLHYVQNSEDAPQEVTITVKNTTTNEIITATAEHLSYENGYDAYEKGAVSP